VDDPDVQEVIADLRRLGRRRVRLRKSVVETSEAIAVAAAKAHAAGVSKVEIAQLAKISRPALDTMLREQQH
jgi:hypothetical protein